MGSSAFPGSPRQTHWAATHPPGALSTPLTLPLSRFLHLLRPRAAPPPLHQDLPPWVIPENPRERPWRNGASPLARPAKGWPRPWPLALVLVGVLVGVLVVVALCQIRCLVEQAIQTQTVGIQGIRGQFTGNFPKLALHRFR